MEISLPMKLTHGNVSSKGDMVVAVETVTIIIHVPVNADHVTKL